MYSVVVTVLREVLIYVIWKKINVKEENVESEMENQFANVTMDTLVINVK